MRAFFGGQIKQECRGDLAVVVAREKTPEGCRYGSFMYPTNSEEFLHLTGVNTYHYPVDRVYMGLSHDAGQEVIRATVDQDPTNVDFRSIDRLVVNPYFLDANLEKPKRVVLDSTPDGYKVVEAQ